MKPSRRDVMKAAVLAAAGALLPRAAFGLEHVPDGHASLPETSRSAWADRVGSTFSVERADGLLIEMRLRSVADLASAQAAGVVGHERAFSLVFEAPRRPALTQGTYDLSGFGSGSLAVFIVPMERARARQRYEAVFNNAVS